MCLKKGDADEEALIDACWGLSYLSETQSHAEAVLASGCLAYLTEQLERRFVVRARRRRRACVCVWV